MLSADGGRKVVGGFTIVLCWDGVAIVLEWQSTSGQYIQVRHRYQRKVTHPHLFSVKKNNK
jgi:hypothetical protein